MEGLVNRHLFLDKRTAKLIETTIHGMSDMNLMSPVEGNIYTGNHGSSPSKIVNFPVNCPSTKPMIMRKIRSNDPLAILILHNHWT